MSYVFHSPFSLFFHSSLPLTEGHKMPRTLSQALCRCSFNRGPHHFPPFPSLGVVDVSLLFPLNYRLRGCDVPSSPGSRSLCLQIVSVNCKKIFFIFPFCPQKLFSSFSLSPCFHKTTVTASEQLHREFPQAHTDAESASCCPSTKPLMALVLRQLSPSCLPSSLCRFFPS